MKNGKIAEAITKYKYPILVLMIGIVLMSLPHSKSEAPEDPQGTQSETRLAGLLSMCRGVGNADALLSDKGAIIVCDGADDAEVRLTVIKAVSAYTGLSFDSIQVIKTRQNQEGQNE